MLAYDPTANPLNNNEWSFPLLEILHIAGFALSIGTIAVVDLRLLGLGLLRRSSQQIWNAMFPWTLTGLIVMLTTGPAIFSSNPVMYLRNASFKFKMVALLIAIVFNYTVQRKVALSDGQSAGAAMLTGVVSLALWISVVFGGLFIAFV